jgi:hypothetical protein
MSEQSWEWGKEKDRSHTGQWALQAMKQGLLEGRYEGTQSLQYNLPLSHLGSILP